MELEIVETEDAFSPFRAQVAAEKTCDCDTPDAAKVWCYRCGYKIKPSVVTRAKVRVEPEVVQKAPASNNDALEEHTRHYSKRRTKRPCEVCGKPFFDRANARTCSDNCRSKASYRRRTASA